MRWTDCCRFDLVHHSSPFGTSIATPLYVYDCAICTYGLHTLFWTAGIYRLVAGIAAMRTPARIVHVIKRTMTLTGDLGFPEVGIENAVAFHAHETDLLGSTCANDIH
jgi:hypothetical protein